jgi:hypothetical protein
MAAALPFLAAELSKQVFGPALEIYGDGFEIGENEIRLLGIDTPEMRAGPQARKSRGHA